jgi:hypothetical protein
MHAAITAFLLRGPNVAEIFSSVVLGDRLVHEVRVVLPAKA